MISTGSEGLGLTQLAPLLAEVGKAFERQLAWLAATQRVLTLDAAAAEIGDIAGPTGPGVQASNFNVPLAT